MLENAISPNSIGPVASRSFRFCVPDEWYRRSKSRSVSSTSSDVSQDTIRRLADLEEAEDEEEDEGDGTAKVKSLEGSMVSDTARGGFTAPMDWRSSISQNRFSSILDSWMRPQSPTVESKSPPGTEKKVVSEPKLVAQRTGDSISSTASSERSDGVNPAEFEQMLVGFYAIQIRVQMLISGRTIWVSRAPSVKPCIVSHRSRSGT